MKTKAKEAEVKQNLHAIQLALERYAVDHDGMYPQDLAAIAVFNIMRELPGNPLQVLSRDAKSGGKYSDGTFRQPEPMRDIRFGEEQFAGNCTYLPWGLTGPGTAAGYYLLAYGSSKTKGQDVDGDGQGDHVVMQLDSPIRFSTTPNIKQQRIPRPDIKELLHSQEE